MMKYLKIISGMSTMKYFKGLLRMIKHRDEMIRMKYLKIIEIG